MYIEFKNAVKKYGDTSENMVYAINHADFGVNKGELCVVLGPSGSGKSTMLNMLGGLDRLDEGSLIVDGKQIMNLSDDELGEYRRRDVGFVFQFFNLIPDLTVEENIQVVSDISESPMDINEVLAALGIAALKDRFPKELSGGQQQRVAIARSISRIRRSFSVTSLQVLLTQKLQRKSSRLWIRSTGSSVQLL